MRCWSPALCWLLLVGSPHAALAQSADPALEAMHCEPADGKGYMAIIRALVPKAPPEGVVVEVEDALGHTYRQRCHHAGLQELRFALPTPAVKATLDPSEALPDPDRYNNHWPRKLLITPWPDAPSDAYLLRYFTGLTFKQGQAPVRPHGAPMMPPAQGPLGLGIGLEGRLRDEHGWQVLANLGGSPFAPSLEPRFSLHGYWLPHPNWGLDGDVGLDLRGTLTTELGTSLILWDAQSGPTATPVLAHQLRAAIGRQAPPAAGSPGYDYGQLTLFRDDTPTLGLASNLSLFLGLDGAWRASLDGQHARPLTEWLSLRLNGSLGWGDARLPSQNRLGVGMASQDWITAQERTTGRLSLLAPLARGLSVPLLGPVATLVQIEGSVFLEGAQLWRADNPARDGMLAGFGAEIVLVQDTLLGFPLALNLGYAMPLFDGSRPATPWPGRLYVTTTDSFFPRLPPSTAAGPGAATPP